MYVCVCVSLSLSLSVCVCVSLSLSLSLCLSVFVRVASTTLKKKRKFIPSQTFPWVPYLRTVRAHMCVSGCVRFAVAASPGNVYVIMT